MIQERSRKRQPRPRGTRRPFVVRERARRRVVATFADEDRARERAKEARDSTHGDYEVFDRDRVVVTFNCGYWRLG